MNKFSERITEWYLSNKRSLPWRDSSDPYIIWLSEIILQQTRVEQGMPYFQRFVENFPDVKSFARADESEILKLWQGLGYYSRARNMHHAATAVVKDFNGKFPASYEDLKKLKGIGEYTAAAIASFAFGQPHAVVDGNVYRFLSRHFGIDTPIDSGEGKKQFNVLANKLLGKKNPGIHNQAMMEIGAMICKPKNPLCMQCPVNGSCVALKNNMIDRLPVKSKKVLVKVRYFFYFLITYKSKFIIRKRTGSDIWKNLYDLPLIETNAATNPEKVLGSKVFQSLMSGTSFKVTKISKPVTHKLTHQNLNTVFISLNTQQSDFLKDDKMQWVTIEKSKSFAFPKLIENFLKHEKN